MLLFLASLPEGSQRDLWGEYAAELWPQLVKFLLSCRFQEADAQDLVAETFAAILEHFDCNYERMLHLKKQYYITALKRKAIDRIRSRPASHEVLGQEDAVLLAFETDDDLFRQLDREENRIVIQNAIAELIPEQQQAVILFYGRNMPLGEVAQAMAKSAQAVNSLLSRARKNLKKAMGMEVS